RGQSHDVAVQRSAQALVRADQDHRAFPDRANLLQRLFDVLRPSRGFPLDPVQELGEGTPPERRLLRLAHLRGRHHLHRPGDLGGGADRPAASPDLLGAMHDSLARAPEPGPHFQVSLNWSAAVFSSALRASPIAFSLPIRARISALRVVRKSVSFACHSRTRSTFTSSTYPFWTHHITATWTSTGTGLYWGCLKISTMRLPRSMAAWVLVSTSEPNWANAASSRNSPTSPFSCPAT